MFSNAHLVIGASAPVRAPTLLTPLPVPRPQTIRRKRKVQIPVSRPGDRETMSEHEEEDSEEDDGYDERSGRGGYGGASGGTGRRGERSSSGKRDRSASRERSASPRSDRRSQTSSVPPRPAKVTLVKSRKNEGGQHNVGGRGTAKTHLTVSM